MFNNYEFNVMVLVSVLHYMDVSIFVSRDFKCILNPGGRIIMGEFII